MKHLLQIVAFAVVALLAVPPALAESICTAASKQSESMECCDVDHVSALSALPDVVQDCDEGCCSVAPQKVPTSAVPDKLKTDSSGPDTSVSIASPTMHPPHAVSAPLVAATGRAEDLPVLLHTLRI